MALSSSSSSYAVVALAIFLVLTGSSLGSTLSRPHSRMAPSSSSSSLSSSLEQQQCLHYYSKSCPKLLSTVRSVVKSAVSRQPILGAALLRLFFHDCFVNGCDASVLLDDTPSFKGEKTAGPNNGSLRGFEVIDKIKSKVEALCPGVVSCADLLTIATRDAVVLLGGPNWSVKLGRRDSKTASFDLANSGVLPGPSSNLSTLFSTFQAQGLSARDMVALSGGHTIGQARCSSFRDRIYNDTNIKSSFAKAKRKICPRISSSKERFIANLDVRTPNHFDNSYFKNLIKKKGLLHSDQVLFNGGSTDSLVRTYSHNRKAFESDFAAAMIRMGDIKPLTAPNGEIRKNCRRVNYKR